MLHRITPTTFKNYLSRALVSPVAPLTQSKELGAAIAAFQECERLRAKAALAEDAMHDKVAALRAAHPEEMDAYVKATTRIEEQVEDLLLSYIA